MPSSPHTLSLVGTASPLSQLGPPGAENHTGAHLYLRAQRKPQGAFQHTDSSDLPRRVPVLKVSEGRQRDLALKAP